MCTRKLDATYDYLPTYLTPPRSRKRESMSGRPSGALATCRRSPLIAAAVTALAHSLARCSLAYHRSPARPRSHTSACPCTRSPPSAPRRCRAPAPPPHTAARCTPPLARARARPLDRRSLARAPTAHTHRSAPRTRRPLTGCSGQDAPERGCGACPQSRTRAARRRPSCRCRAGGPRTSTQCAQWG